MLNMRMTPQEFDRFIKLPQNADRIFELIDGEVVEKTSSVYLSQLAGEIAFHLKILIREQRLQGHITGEGGGYKIGDERYVPDVAYFSAGEINRTGYNTAPPDLVVEVESNVTKDSAWRLQTKLFHYRAAGVVVWVVYADTKEVKVYDSDNPVLTLRLGDTLDGGHVLSGFNLPVRDIFAS